MMQHQPIVKRGMERMREHTGLISSYQLLITATCTKTGGKMKGTPEQLTGAHFYLDIPKSGYLFHAVGNVMIFECGKRLMPRP